jgi:hypothetical protein
MSGVILVAFALGLDNFAVAMGIGLSGTDRRLRIALIFGIFEAAMPLIGLPSVDSSPTGSGVRGTTWGVGYSSPPGSTAWSRPGGVLVVNCRDPPDRGGSYRCGTQH